MKYVPSISRPVTGVGAGLEVKPLAGVRRSKRVQARTLPPLVVQPHMRREAPAEATVEEEKRHDPHLHGERRTYCRRIEHLPFLLELRSGRERRQHNQRASDATDHIDIKI